MPTKRRVTSLGRARDPELRSAAPRVGNLYPSLDKENVHLTEDDTAESSGEEDKEDYEDSSTGSPTRTPEGSGVGQERFSRPSSSPREQHLSRRILHGEERDYNDENQANYRREKGYSRGSNYRSAAEESELYEEPKFYDAADYGGRFQYPDFLANQLLWLVVISVFVCLTFCYLIVPLLLNRSPAHELYRRMPGSFEVFKKELRVLQKTYPSQFPATWTNFRASVKHVLNSSEPKEPATLLLVHSSASSAAAACLATDLATILVKAYYEPDGNFLEIGRADYSYTDSPDEVKLRLDQLLNSGLDPKIGKKNVAVVRDIQSLPGQSPLMLHSYCDNDHAPFKDAVLILTLALPSSGDDGSCSADRNNCEEELTEKQCGSLAEDALYGYWCEKNKEGLNRDKVGAILSRIANNVVCIKKEDTVHCR